VVLLGRDDFRDTWVAGSSLRARDRVAPGIGTRRIACIELAESGEIERVLAEKRAHPFEVANVNAEGTGLIHSRRCG